MTKASSVGQRAVALRRAVGAVVVDGFFRGVSSLGRLHPQASPQRHGVHVTRNVAYVNSGLAEHRLDVWAPAHAGHLGTRCPALLYIHGGGFRILSKDTHWVMALAFARRGFVVFNVSYRLAPGHAFPAALQDVCAAWTWMVAHADKYGADLSELVVAGESAGANLATAATLASCFQRPEPYARAVFDAGVVPKAVLPMCGVHQVSDPGRFRRRKPHKIGDFLDDRLTEVSHAYLHKAQLSHPNELELADPLTILESAVQPERALPAFMSGVGTADPLLDDTRRLHAALVSRGARSEVQYYRGQPHAFHAFVFLPEAQRCWGHQFDFLERVMGRALPVAHSAGQTTGSSRRPGPDKPGAVRQPSR